MGTILRRRRNFFEVKMRFLKGKCGQFCAAGENFLRVFSRILKSWLTPPLFHGSGARRGGSAGMISPDRKPYQNPKSQKCAGNFFSSSEKIILSELKKIIFYSFDSENSHLSNGAKIRTIRAIGHKRSR